jgi:RNA polymerase sigma-70 factor (ECF subfamily)
MLNDEILRGCKNGDSRSQRKLYDQTAARMMGVCLRYCTEEEEAKDLLQDGFVKVFQHITAYRGEGSLEGWMKKIFVNTALENIRRKKIVFERLENENIATAELVFSDGKLEAKELLRIIRTMPEGFRVVFNLFAIEGYSHQEIAEKLNITTGTSKSQFARARQYLQKLLAEEISIKH